MLNEPGVATATRAPLRVHVDYADEGRDGDYNPADPSDRPHLRFWVYATPNPDITDLDPDMSPDPDGYQYVCTTSFCTQVTLGREPSVDDDQAVMRALANYLLDHLGGITTDRGLRQLAQDLSWVRNNDIADYHRSAPARGTSTQTDPASAAMSS